MTLLWHHGPVARQSRLSPSPYDLILTLTTTLTSIMLITLHPGVCSLCSRYEQMSQIFQRVFNL